jgi:hypothetical protein
MNNIAKEEYLARLAYRWKCITAGLAEREKGVHRM